MHRVILLAALILAACSDGGNGQVESAGVSYSPTSATAGIGTDAPGNASPLEIVDLEGAVVTVN